VTGRKVYGIFFINFWVVILYPVFVKRTKNVRNLKTFKKPFKPIFYSPAFFAMSPNLASFLSLMSGSEEMSVGSIRTETHLV